MLSPTAHAHVLIATQGFAALGLVTPDYVIPNGFIPLVNGTLNYAGADLVAYAALPTDGVTALKRTGATIPNVATNFAGKSASANAPGTLNYQGLWWKSPGGSEDGWGINFAHQGKTIFGTWFTYDATGKGWWLTLIADDSKRRMGSNRPTCSPPRARRSTPCRSSRPGRPQRPSARGH